MMGLWECWLPGQVSDVVAVQSENLQGSLVRENLIGNVVQGAVTVVKLSHLLLLPAQAGQAEHPRQPGGEIS